MISSLLWTSFLPGTLRFGLCVFREVLKKCSHWRRLSPVFYAYADFGVPFLQLSNCLFLETEVAMRCTMGLARKADYSSKLSLSPCLMWSFCSIFGVASRFQWSFCLSTAGWNIVFCSFSMDCFFLNKVFVLALILLI